MTSHSLQEHTEAILTITLNNTEDVVVVFDTDLNYLLANTAACKLLAKQKQEIEGKNLLELFPNLTASKSHRYLLQALSGEQVLNAITEGTFTRAGAKYSSSYYPLKIKEKVSAILVITKKLYYPEV